MIRSKFISCLPEASVRQLNISFGNQDNAPLDQIVKLATILEDGSRFGGNPSNIWPVAAVDTTPRATAQTGFRCFQCGEYGHMRHQCTVTQSRGSKKCFKCGLEGHFARECRSRVAHSMPNSNLKASCGFCGKINHALMNCQQFKEKFLKCVWCGSLDHESYKCSHNPSQGAQSGNDWKSEL